MPGSLRSGAALALTASFIAAACSTPAPIVEEWDPDGEITTPIQRIPDRLDPNFAGLTEEQRHLGMMFEPLLRFDPDTYEPIPAAAKEPPRVSDDRLIYTFTLRDGLKFSDGSLVEAKHFVYGWSRVCDHKLGPPGANALLIAGCAELRRLDPQKTSAEALAAAQQEVGLRAASEKEFVVTLTRPLSYFLALTASPLAHPVRASDVASAGSEYGTRVTSLVGNGPFRLVEWIPGHRLVFERNEHYRNPAKLKRWTKVVVPYEVTLAAYRNDEVDFFGGFPYGRIAAVSDHSDVIDQDPKLRSERVEAPGATTDYFLLSVARPPFNDRAVRQAFAKGFDRGAQVRDFLKYGSAAHTLIPPGVPGHDTTDRFQTFDADAAKRLLETASPAARQGLGRIRFVFDDPLVRTVAEILQQQLKKNLGIEIELEHIDRQALGELLKDPRTVPHIRWARYTFIEPDPHGNLSAFRSANAVARQIGYRNADFDAIHEEASRESDPRRRSELYARAMRVVSEDVPAIWSYWAANVYLRKPRVKGVTDAKGDFEYGLSRVTEIYVTKRKA